MDARISSTAYVTERRLFFGCGDGRLVALDRSTGKDIWVHRAADGIVASPAVDGGLVLVGSEDYFFYAVDMESGKVLMMVDVPMRKQQEIYDMIVRRHPEAAAGGFEPTIPAFP